jgi:hypothetical protein
MRNRCLMAKKRLSDSLMHTNSQNIAKLVRLIERTDKPNYHKIPDDEVENKGKPLPPSGDPTPPLNKYRNTVLRFVNTRSQGIPATSAKPNTSCPFTLPTPPLTPLRIAIMASMVTDETLSIGTELVPIPTGTLEVNEKFKAPLTCTNNWYAAFMAGTLAGSMGIFRTNRWIRPTCCELSAQKRSPTGET